MESKRDATPSQAFRPKAPGNLMVRKTIDIASRLPPRGVA